MSDPWVQNTQQWINLTYPGMLGILPLVVDGQTGWNTIYALIRALQHELGITALSNNFGPGTLAALTAVSPVNDSTVNKNIIRIAQGAMYCKGYNGGNGALDGVWDAVPVAGMQSLRTNMGLSAGDGSIEPKVFKALLNMDAFTLVSGGTSAIRSIQQSLNGRYLHRQDFYVIPTDGYYTRDVQRALMFAIQYEVGIADGVANGNFGPATKSGLQTYGALTLGSTDTTRYLVHLFQAALIFNGYSVAYDGNYGSGTRTQTLAFQEFVALPQNGNADVQTWGSLLVSTGDADRPGAPAPDSRHFVAPGTSTLAATSPTRQMTTPTSVSNPAKPLGSSRLEGRSSLFSRPAADRSSTSPTSVARRSRRRLPMPHGGTACQPMPSSTSP